MGVLELTDVWKLFGNEPAVRNVSLQVAEGELLVLLGPSGCGKSTILRLIAGLDDVSSGTIALDGRRLNDVAERDRDIAMVFQSYALYPHMTVERNMGFPLKHRGVRSRERRERVLEVARMLGLEGELGRKPGQLSGGQRQRVAMGRAMVREPKLFLLDEPLSNLDAALRVQMRTEIHALQRRLGVGMVFVTHDQVEAMTLGDRVAVMQRGVLQQIGPPDHVYRRPANVFVASFMGSPPMTLVEASLSRGSGDGVTVRVGEHDIRVDDAELASQPGLRASIGARVIVGVRAEDVALAGTAAADRRVRGSLFFEEQLGSSLVGYFTVPGVTASPATLDPSVPAPEPAPVRPLVAPPQYLPARFAADVTLSVGAAVELALQPGALRFFDAVSGQQI